MVGLWHWKIITLSDSEPLINLSNLIKEPLATPNRATPKSCYPFKKNLKKSRKHSKQIIQQFKKQLESKPKKTKTLSTKNMKTKKIAKNHQKISQKSKQYPKKHQTRSKKIKQNQTSSKEQK